MKAVRLERDSSKYPLRLLQTLGGKAPKVLYVAGNQELLNNNAVSICGSRQPTFHGSNVTGHIGNWLGKMRITVISGDARGVDYQAHYSSLETGGSTIFVLPTGISKFKPKGFLTTVWDWDRVLVVSQYEPDDDWSVGRAMGRNKVVIGLSKALIVMEAKPKGGSIAAGREALKMKVPVFVSQHVRDDWQTEGNEILVREGARRFITEHDLYSEVTK